MIYAPDMIPGVLRGLYHLNPMVGLLLAFRAALFDGFRCRSGMGLLVGCSVFILALGVWAFRRTEANLADRL